MPHEFMVKDSNNPAVDIISLINKSRTCYQVHNQMKRMKHQIPNLSQINDGPNAAFFNQERGKTINK